MKNTDECFIPTLGSTWLKSDQDKPISIIGASLNGDLNIVVEYDVIGETMMYSMLLENWLIEFGGKSWNRSVINGSAFVDSVLQNDKATSIDLEDALNLNCAIEDYYCALFTRQVTFDEPGMSATLNLNASRRQALYLKRALVVIDEMLTSVNKD